MCPARSDPLLTGVSVCKNQFKLYCIGCLDSNKCISDENGYELIIN